MRDRSEGLDVLLGLLNTLDYKFPTLRNFARAVRGAEPLSPKVCLLRVDVDSDPRYCQKLSQIFKANQCAASFYFRLNTIDPDVMRDLRNEGFEVGYHYEELATYAKQMHLRSGEEVMARIDQCRDLFRQNFVHFSKVSGGRPETVASHGDFANRKLGITNSVIVNEAVRAELGIEAEAYDEDLVAKFEDIIVDRGPPAWWAPTAPDCAAAEHQAGAHCMRVLLHPRQWRKSIYWNTRENIQRVVEGLRY